MSNPTTSLGTLDALPVGLLVLAIGLSLGGPTGYAINPARDLGPRISHFILPIKNKRDSDWSYSWIPVIGPIAGGCLAAFVYSMILINFYEKVFVYFIYAFYRQHFVCSNS
jgi:glycerol uptake facilitator protein